ncbi:MAG: hypothetical protein Ct9H300mP16_07770 [Pseudomonadota bacterium]|nr:MAG: hypothetical protein Ct9H300mP16_07770 [Pseudomonadota bacterium]
MIRLLSGVCCTYSPVANRNRTVGQVVLASAGRRSGFVGTPAREQILLSGQYFREVAFFDMTVAPYSVSQRGDLDGQCVVVVVQAARQFTDGCFISRMSARSMRLSLVWPKGSNMNRASAQTGQQFSTPNIQWP